MAIYELGQNEADRKQKALALFLGTLQNQQENQLKQQAQQAVIDSAFIKKGYAPVQNQAPAQSLIQRMLGIGGRPQAQPQSNVPNLQIPVGAGGSQPQFLSPQQTAQQNAQNQLPSGVTSQDPIMQMFMQSLQQPQSLSYGGKTYQSFGGGSDQSKTMQTYKNALQAAKAKKELDNYMSPQEQIDYKAKAKVKAKQQEKATETSDLFGAVSGVMQNIVSAHRSYSQDLSNAGLGEPNPAAGITAAVRSKFGDSSVANINALKNAVQTGADTLAKAITGNSRAAAVIQQRLVETMPNYKDTDRDVMTKTRDTVSYVYRLQKAKQQFGDTDNLGSLVDKIKLSKADLAELDSITQSVLDAPAQTELKYNSQETPGGYDFNSALQAMRDSKKKSK